MITWSYSSIKTFDQCPRKYYHLKVARDVRDEGGVAAIYGQEVHKAAENYVRDGVPVPDKFSFVEPVVSAFNNIPGEKHCELKLGVRKTPNGYEPCEFFAKDVWWRGVADLLIINGGKAWLADYNDMLVIFRNGGAAAGEDLGASGGRSASGDSDSGGGSGSMKLGELLPASRHRLGDVARRLAVSARSLQRRLRDEGTSFAAIAREIDCTMAQLALAWVIAQGKDIFPIPGTKRMKYLIENSDAAQITFTNEELKKLDVLLPLDSAFGMRYTEAGMQGINK